MPAPRFIRLAFFLPPLAVWQKTAGQHGGMPIVPKLWPGLWPIIPWAYLMTSVRDRPAESKAPGSLRFSGDPWMISLPPLNSLTSSPHVKCPSLSV